MKRLLLCLLLLMLALPAHAATATYTGRVREDMPLLTVTVRQEGAFDSDARYPYTLAAHITSADGSLVQEVTWPSNETPNRERAAALVRLVDYNFDGYSDLQLLTAQGASEVFYCFALWNPETGRFDGLTTLYGEPLLVDNPIFIPERKEIRSVVHDGWRYRTDTLLFWRDDRTIEERVVAEVYDPGVNKAPGLDSLIGERLTIVDGGERYVLWDQQYVEDWYFGLSEGSTDHRTDALTLFTQEGRYPFPIQVTHEDWVYLRSLPSTYATPLAQIPGGETVYVLLSGIGQDSGWVLVWYGTPASGGDTLGWVGYVWHSFLGPWPLRVANTDWVNVRQRPDKESEAIAQLDGGMLVYPTDEDIDGWQPVIVYYSDGGSFTGYIWHSFLEEAEY